MRLPRLPSVLWCLAACAPNPAAPVPLMAIVKGKDGNYAPTQVEVRTLRNITAMSGDVASFYGNGTIVVDQNDPALQQTGLTDEQVAEIFLKHKGGAMAASYIQRGDTFWPTDFHTWNMATAYYDWELAYLYFQDLGVPSGATQDSSGNVTCASGSLCGASVYYWPSFTLVQTSTSPQTDNVLYYSPVQSILLLPFDQQFTTVPVAMNAGVLAHEYSHRVFNMFIYEGQAFPTPLGDWLGQAGATPQINLLKAMDEGLADYFAYGESSDTAFGSTTRFIDDSYPSQGDARDMAGSDKCMSSGMVTALCSLQAADFLNQGLQYTIGTVFAASLYQAGKVTGQEKVLQKAVLASYNDTTPPTQGINQLLYLNLANQDAVTLGAVANAILLHVTDPTLQTELCNQFLDRMQLYPTDICPTSGLPCGCPATAGGGTACPPVDPNAKCMGF